MRLPRSVPRFCRDLRYWCLSSKTGTNSWTKFAISKQFITYFRWKQKRQTSFLKRWRSRWVEFNFSPISHQFFQRSKFHTEASAGGTKQTICLFGTFRTIIHLTHAMFRVSTQMCRRQTILSYSRKVHRSRKHHSFVFNGRSRIERTATFFFKISLKANDTAKRRAWICLISEMTWRTEWS